MFTPLSKMSADLQAHLRYPEDIFSIQSAIYGRYHLTNPSAVLRRQRRLAAVADGRGRAHSPRPLSVVSTFNSQGQLVSTNPARMAPLYQVMALPGSIDPGLHHHRGLRAGGADQHRASGTRTST